MNICGIYKIESITHPERCYVGSAINISKRWINHISELRLNIYKFTEEQLKTRSLASKEMQRLRKLNNITIKI